MAEIFRVVKPITHEEFVGCVESDKLRRILQLSRNVLVQQGANFERAGRSLPEQRHESIERSSRIDNVLDQKDVLPFQPRLGIVQKPDDTTRLSRVTVARCNEEIDLQWPPDMSNEIAQENEASLQQSKDEQLAVRIRVSDLLAHFGHTPGDCLFVVSDALESTSGKSRICCC